jgi:uracil-DNA glycosylase family 4
VYTSKITPKLTKPIECSGCPLEHIGTGFSHPEGRCTNGVLIIGEALGLQEMIDGLPFRPRGAAGAVLERALRQCGYSREQFGVFNIVNCQPPNNELVGAPYELEAARHCRVHFRKVIHKYQPKVILALGNTPLYSLTTYGGKKQSMDWLQGFILECQEFNLPIIASYHPAYIARGNYQMFPILCGAIKKSVITARNGKPVHQLNYVTNAGEYELRKLIELCQKEPDALLCPDLETEGDKDAVLQLLTDGEESEDGKKKAKQSKTETRQLITQVNLAVEPTNSMAFLYTSTTAPLVKQLLEMDNPKVNHNLWFFDTPVLEYNKIYLRGFQHDTLWLFHHLYPDLPGKGSKGKSGDDKADGSLANLQFCASVYNFPFPWKHLSDSNPGFYGCCDCHSVLKLFWGLYDDANRLGVWKGYTDMVCDMWPILRDAQRRGIPVTRDKLREFRKMMQSRAAEVDVKVQQYIPDELRKTAPKFGFVRTPKVIQEIQKIEVDGNLFEHGDKEKLIAKIGFVQREYLIEGKIARCKCNKIRKTKIDYWMSVPNAEWEQNETKLRAPDPNCEDCAGHGWVEWEAGLVTRWCKLRDFNVTAPYQLKLYAKYMRHEIPKNSKKKYAMDAETLDKLIRKHKDPVYKWTKEMREFVKMDTTYGAGWMPEQDECVHPQFGFLPATGQFNSVGPNCQNDISISKKKGDSKQIAIDWNDCMEAWPGYSWLSADYKSFHAQTLGVEAGDMSYIRLAKIDAHSYLATRMLKIPGAENALAFTDDELKDWLKWHRKNYVLGDGTPFEMVRNGKAKPGILGWGFGLGHVRLHKQNEETLKDEREAKYVLDMLDDAFPITAKFRQTIPLLAERNGNKLVNEKFGCIRWFYDIRRYDPKKGDWTHGGDWEKAIAYLPANTAFCHKKQALKKLDDIGACELYWFCNDKHDALKFHCQDKLIAEAAHVIKNEMEFRSDVIVMPDGQPFNCSVDVEVGKTWARMEEYHV